MFGVGIRILAILCGAYLAAGAYAQISLMQLLDAPQITNQEARIYKGLQFRNSQELAIFAQEEDRNALFPWSRYVNDWQALAILSISAGFFGGVVRDFKALYDQDAQHQNTWLIGLVIGPAILLASVVYPAIMTQGEWQLRPTSVVAVCFLGGVFSQQAWTYLQAAADKVFSKKRTI
jgi:hypothetical protein